MGLESIGDFYFILCGNSQPLTTSTTPSASTATSSATTTTTTTTAATIENQRQRNVTGTTFRRIQFLFCRGSKQLLFFDQFLSLSRSLCSLSKQC